MGIRSLLSRRRKQKSASNSPLENAIFGRVGSRRNQVQELECVFRKFDANGDGKISSSELGSIMSSLGQQVSEEELQKMVKEGDSDGDGFINLEEFIELNTRGVDSAAVLEDLRSAFVIFDMDGNGSISAEELQNVLRSLGDETTIQECRKMISGVDVDGDGQIDFEEFKTMMTRNMEMTAGGS